MGARSLPFYPAALTGEGGTHSLTIHLANLPIAFAHWFARGHTIGTQQADELCFAFLLGLRRRPSRHRAAAVEELHHRSESYRRRAAWPRRPRARLGAPRLSETLRKSLPKSPRSIPHPEDMMYHGTLSKSNSAPSALGIIGGLGTCVAPLAFCLRWGGGPLQCRFNVSDMTTCRV